MASWLLAAPTMALQRSVSTEAAVRRPPEGARDDEVALLRQRLDGRDPLGADAVGELLLRAVDVGDAQLGALSGEALGEPVPDLAETDDRERATGEVGGAEQLLSRHPDRLVDAGRGRVGRLTDAAGADRQAVGEGGALADDEHVLGRGAHVLADARSCRRGSR